MGDVADDCREDVRRLFEGEITAKELIESWRWLDGVERRDIPRHWQDEREDET